MVTERRLIDANALKIAFKCREMEDIDLYGGVHIAECFQGYEANEIVDKMPTVDAVEVVRCKDCKYYKPRHQSAHWKQTALCCTRTAWVNYPPDGFCSYGERRTDNAE